MKITVTILSLGIGIALSASLAQVRSTPTNPTKQNVGATLVSSAASGTATPYTQIDFNWTYVANLPACAGSLTACYDGFVLTNTTTNQTIADPSAIGPAAQSYNWVPAVGVPYGNLTFSLAAHGYDENGNVVLSTPDTVVVDVKVTSLNGPTGLTGKPQ